MLKVHHRSEPAPVVPARLAGSPELPVPRLAKVQAGSGGTGAAPDGRGDALRRFVVEHPIWVTLPALVAISVATSVGALFILTEAMGLGYGPTFMRSITIATVAPILVSAPIGGYIVRLLREVESARQHAQAMAWIDPLTGLPNRRWIAQLGAAELHRSRQHGADCAVALLDIDDFKRVNDEFGHGIGDAVLQGVARMLADTGQDGDRVARWGGEEFVVLMPGASMKSALDRGERLRAAVERLAIGTGGGEPVRCTVSIGVATAGLLDDFERLVNRADRAMYRAKAAGKNQVTVG